MINVSFLLLVFFLLSATFVTAPPVETAPPLASSAMSADGVDVFLSSDGRLLLRDGTLVTLEAVEGMAVKLHASAEREARGVAQSLSELGNMGAKNVVLVTRARAME